MRGIRPASASMVLLVAAFAHADDTVDVISGNCFSLQLSNDTLTVTPSAKTRIENGKTKVDCKGQESDGDLVKPLREKVWTSAYAERRMKAILDHVSERVLAVAIEEDKREIRAHLAPRVAATSDDQKRLLAEIVDEVYKRAVGGSIAEVKVAERPEERTKLVEDITQQVYAAVTKRLEEERKTQPEVPRPAASPGPVKQVR